MSVDVHEALRRLTGPGMQQPAICKTRQSNELTYAKHVTCFMRN